MQNNKIIYVISFFSGFLSLAQEILWMRLISFAGMSVPQSFSYTLALFLIGISIGAYIGKKLCKNNKNISIDYLGRFFFLAAITDLLLILLVYLYSHFITPSILILGFCVLICASIRGIIFPMVHHVGTSVSKSGKQISNVYFSNVFGSAIAPLLISFIALDFLNTQQVYFLVCFMTIVISIICIYSKKNTIIYTLFLLIAFSFIFLPEKLFFEFSKNSYQENTYPSLVLENKHGVIQIYDDGKDKVVFGANVYDGKLNTNIFHDSNGIERAYLLTALKSNAENVLIIGLSTGSWAKVLSSMPDVKKITIIEINPNYIELIKKYPEVSGLLKDPRVEIIVDDGRKWLKKNDDQKFDLILMNTTWHWRAYASNLLSQNFMSIVNQRLTEKGLVFYNSTQSMNAYTTAHKIFPYVYQYKFFVLASKQPIVYDEKTMQKNLCLLEDSITQRKIFVTSNQCNEALFLIKRHKLIPFDEIIFHRPEQDFEIITDDNMITEFKYGKGL